MAIIASLRVLCCFPLPALEEFGTMFQTSAYVYICTYIFSALNLIHPPDTKTELLESLKCHRQV